MLVSKFDLGNGGMILQWKLGAMENFTYLIMDQTQKVGAVIDPGWDAEFIVGELEKSSCKLSCVLLTHHHFDHVDALKPLCESFPS